MKNNSIHKRMIKILYLLFFPIFLTLTSSFILPNSDEVISHINDPNYDPFNNSYPLYKYDNDKNMLPPSLFKYDTGKISLKESSKPIILTENSIYTFVFYIKDYKELKNDYLKSDNYINYIYKTPNYGEHKIDRVYKCIPNSTPSEFLNYYKEDKLNLLNPIIQTSSDFSKIFLTISTTNNYTNLFKITDFEFVFNSRQSSGIISLGQLYKGDINSYEKYYEYNHAPYGLSKDIIGPYKDKTEIDLTIPYKDNQISVDDIKSNILAFDKGDYEYKTVYVLNDSFTQYKRVLNKPLKLTFKASDSLNNTSTITFNITIVDNIPPTITQLNEKITFSYKDIINKQSILDNFSIIDNYSYKVDTSISGINLDTSNPIGKYKIKLKSNDNSNNISTYETEIEIVDDIPPIIEGPSLINVKKGEQLSEQEILNQFKAYDEIDNNLPIKIIQNEYFSNYKTIGEYVLMIQASDKSGNTTKKTIQINVIDDSGPIFYLNKTNLTMYQGDKIDTSNLIKNLIKANLLQEKNYIDISYTSSSIQQDKQLTLGEHQLLLTCKSDDNQIQYITLNINVIQKENNTNIFSTFINKIIEFFQSIFKKFNI